MSGDEKVEGLETKAVVEETAATDEKSGLTEEKSELSGLQAVVKQAGEDVKSLERQVGSDEKNVVSSVQKLFDSVKTLSYNQSVLENKLEDVLKNQLNTDNVVNKMMKQVDKLNDMISQSRNGLGNSAGYYGSSNKNSSYSLYADSSRRGPGRPRKDQTPPVYERSSNDSSSALMLPNGSTQISKSRRYFLDPNYKDDVVSTSGRSKKLSNAVGSASGTPSSTGEKRKRGRPPKKKTVDTVIIKHLDDETDELYHSQEATADAHDLLADNSDVKDLKSLSGGLSSANQLKIKQTIFSSPPAKGGFIGNLENTDGEHAGLTTRQEMELDKRRDDREKMLVNLKYNDRDKAKSFMQSHRKLLQAMKEEEKRKRMAPAVHDVSSSSTGLYPPNSVQSIMNSPSPATLAQAVENQSEKRDSLEQIGKVGLSSILNSVEKQQLKDPELVKLENLSSNHPSLNISDNDHTNEIDDSMADPLLREKPQEVHDEAIDDELEEAENDNENLDHDQRGNKRQIDDDDDEEENYDDEDFEPNTSNAKRHLRKKRSISTRNSIDETLASATQMRTSSSDGTAAAVAAAASLTNAAGTPAKSSNIATDHPIELICIDGLFYSRNQPSKPITIGEYLEYKFQEKKNELIQANIKNPFYIELLKHDKMNAHVFSAEIEYEADVAYKVLCNTTLTEEYVNSLEYFLLEFFWENRLVGLGMRLNESKRTWQRRKALFALFEFWRDQSIEKRGFLNYSILHAVKEMESYRVFINRSVSWFYNHITLLKMILYDLCDNVETQWREWMFPKNVKLPIVGQDESTVENINKRLDDVLKLDFLDAAGNDADAKLAASAAAGITENISVPSEQGDEPEQAQKPVEAEKPVQAEQSEQSEQSEQLAPLNESVQSEQHPVATDAMAVSIANELSPASEQHVTSAQESVAEPQTTAEQLSNESNKPQTTQPVEPAVLSPPIAAVHEPKPDSSL